jgi:hypothetical protein
MGMGAPSENYIMSLLPEWRKIVRKARSFKAMAAAAACSVAEMVLPIYFTWLPKGVFALLSLTAIFGGMYFRITAQKGYQDGDK